MPEIRVTEDQQDRLEALREELEAAYADGYASVSDRDLVAYLLDTYTPPAEREADDGDVTDGSREDTAADPDAAAEESEGSEAGSDDDQSGDDEQQSGNDGEETGDDEEESGGDEGGSEERSEDDENGDDGSKVEAMMNLLDEHEDDWRETDAGEEPYEVDLPDGSTERARTKDDVRRILFQHY